MTTALLGVMAGLGLLAVQVSNARSYLSDAPETCINCHVMSSAYGTWAHGSHRRDATCNDCHVPHDNPIRMLVFKAMDGLRHAAVFTARAEPQALRANRAAVPVIQQNCVRCHETTVMNVSNPAMGDGAGTEVCWRCHRETPHGRTLSLSSTPHLRRPALPAVGVLPLEGLPAGAPTQ